MIRNSSCYRYAEALELCRALAAAAPLPVVCNNPNCDNLAGVSEAAAASKLCAGCRCRSTATAVLPARLLTGGGTSAHAGSWLPLAKAVRDWESLSPLTHWCAGAGGAASVAGAAAQIYVPCVWFW
jgi:hypothetical protein